MHFKELNSSLLLDKVNQITIALPVFSISNHVQLIAQRHILVFFTFSTFLKQHNTLHLSTFERYSVTIGMLMLLDYAQPK